MASNTEHSSSFIQNPLQESVEEIEDFVVKARAHHRIVEHIQAAACDHDEAPQDAQHQIAIQLASVLQAVVCQKHLPATNGEMVPAFEIMVLTPAIRNLIREGKVHQIDGIIYTSAAENMIAMDTSIFNLYKAVVISKHVAISEATNPEMMSKRINLN